MKAAIVSSMSMLFVLAVVSAASAQLTAAQEGPVVYSHHHLNVTSLEEHKKFWVDTLGGNTHRVRRPV